MITQYSQSDTISVFGEHFIGKSPMMVGITISQDRAGNNISKVRTFNARRDVGQQITDASVLYLCEEKKRTQKWFQACGIQVPLGGTKLGFIRSIAQTSPKINTSSNNSSTSPGEQHQHRTTTLSNRMILEKASQTVDSQKLTPGQRSALQVFQKHLDKLRELDTKKQEQQKIIDDARKRGARQVEYQAAINRRNILTTQINRESTKLLEVENTPVLRRVLEQAKNVIVDEQTAIRKQALTDYRKKRTESRERTEARHKILRVAKELNHLLLREDKKHHVPDSMKKAVASALDLLELDTVNAAERIAKYDTLLEAAGKRFTEVIVKTQVYDSTLSRSAFMRSKSALLQMATSFMAESTTSINMIEDAIRQYKRGYRQQAMKTARAVLDSMVANAVLVSLIYALRDDDEDETFVEKYFSALTSEIVDGLNPLTYIPWVKDAWSIAQGFDVERSDMSLISDIADALTIFGKLCAKDTDAMSEKELSEHRRKIAAASWGLVEQVANFFGLPMRNVRRDVTAFINTGINTVQNVKNGIVNNPRSFWSEIKEAVQDVTPVLGWFNDSTSDKLYDALAAKDTAQINRLKIAYCDDEGKFNASAYRSAVRKGLRENDSRIRTAAKARLSGDHTKANKLLNQIAAEGRFDRSDISAAIKAEYNHLKGD